MDVNGLDSGNPHTSTYVCERRRKSHCPGIFLGENPLDSSFPLFLIELFLIVCITRIFRFLLKPLRQPRIVSDILGGMSVGPSMLGRDKSFTKAIFPMDSQFILQNIGMLGFIYCLFVYAVKMDLTLARKASKKQLNMALFGFLIPYIISLTVSFSTRKNLDSDFTKPQIIGVVTCVFSVSSFPVIEGIIRELNLLNSEVGRLSLSVAIINDVVGIACLVIFEIARQFSFSPIYSLWTTVSAIVIGAFILGFRYVLVWIAQTTPKGKPVHEAYVVLILLMVLVLSFSTDITGLNLAIGPLVLGLVAPTGPPLGSMIVTRMDTIVNDILMPFGYAFVGMATDIKSINWNWGVIAPLFYIAFSACVSKFLASYWISRFYEIPCTDSLAIAFVSGMRGQVELLLYLHWVVLKVITVKEFSMLVILSILITGISTPMVNLLYDPTRPYMVNKRRAIQFTAPDKELKIVTCIHDQESVAGFINLLELSNPTLTSPFRVFAIRAIELVGRSHPVFVEHENQTEAFELTGYNRIHNALTAFQELMGENVKCHYFTSVSPKRTMYQDVCKLALVKKAIIIILPFTTETLDNPTEVVHHGVLHSVNANVLSHAPCSVGILVDRTAPYHTHHANCSVPQMSHHFAVIFLGGADAREALAFADRMASNPNVSLSVVRFLAHNGEGDNLMEKKLDDGLVTWFWVKNEGNPLVVYKEVVVSNGAETVLAIQAMMNNNLFDLWIVGRKNGINPVLIQGLSNWSKNNELGVIGDFIASTELVTNASLLVVQQQILRGQEAASRGFVERLSSFRY